uniref:Phosphoribosylformylglycinamidine synthase n=1 Tax=Rousettus aegyptiacus TaxID=9407 RepID=A0A7J8GDS7_ROUAE|nr:phosphoribosylformylglycinamidine synthase [Rousettus aegyptiacus]
MSSVLHFYVRPSGHESAASGHTQRKLQGKLPELQSLKTELCYNVNWTAESLPSTEEMKKLMWLFGCPLLLDDVAQESWLISGSSDLLLEVGPRLNFSTPASTNIVSVCQAAGLGTVDRVEITRRYLLSFTHPPSAEMETIALATLHDRMTEQHFPCPIQSFSLGRIPTPLDGPINILAEGRPALERANQELGLALDSWDLDFYTKRFQELQRNPSIVEAFDLAQSNSEHSRHWFFKGQLHLDGQELAQSLFESIMSTQASSNPNNVLKFCDNSSAIQGREVQFLRPEDPTQPSCFRQQQGLRHVVFTAETHNFPTGVAPFCGATTGTGGRIRDVQCTGRGAHVVAGTAGYCFGNLHIPGYSLPWEDLSFQYPRNLARPLKIAIEASNGASDYGNKFGEPVLAGFARSLGLQLPDGQRREWIKPIMFSGGIGSMEAEHVSKEPPEPGMDVVKVGGLLLRHNLSGRFESRWATVRVGPGPALMLRGMEGAVLPVWSAHGEGYMAFSSPELQAQIEAKGLAPLHWADDDGNPTEQYPLNPNGSPGGVAGVCSPDGRHLALMPHPERAVRPWQWAWRPPPFDTLTTSPWLQLFINARNWTQEGGC